MTRDTYAYDFEDDFEDDRLMFADPGGNSALRAVSASNPRNLPCPNCDEPNKLTPADKQRGYQYDSCADAADGGGALMANYKYNYCRSFGHSYYVKGMTTDGKNLFLYRDCKECGRSVQQVINHKGDYLKEQEKAAYPEGYLLPRGSGRTQRSNFRKDWIEGVIRSGRAKSTNMRQMPKEKVSKSSNRKRVVVALNKKKGSKRPKA